MGRMSFTQELKALAKATEEVDAGGCWWEVIHLKNPAFAGLYRSG